MTSFLFDIETQPLSEEEIRRLTPEFDPNKVKLGNRTKPETIEAFLKEEEESYWQEIFDKAGLDFVTARVLLITYRFEDGETKVHEACETELLGEFWSRVHEVIRTNGRAIGFNIADFDVPFLVGRTWLNPTPLVIPSTLYNDDKWLNRAFVDVRKTLQLGVWENKFRKGDLNYWGRLFGAEGKSEESGKFIYQIYEEDRERALTYCQTEMDCLEAVAKGVRKWTRVEEKAPAGDFGF